MTFSQLLRLVAVVCAAVWLAAPASLFAPLALGAPGCGPARAAQIDSPLPPPLSPLVAPPDSPLPTPQPDPAPGFETFLPGLSGQAPVGAESQPPGPPPDLGTLLNYVAGAVVVIGVTLKIYWRISDRRKKTAR